MKLEAGVFQFTDEQNEKIAKLQNLIKDCKNLKIGSEIELIGRYLSANSWEVEKSFQAIHDYYDFKNKYPTWITKQSPEDFKDIIQLKCRMLLVDKNGKYLLIQKLVDAFDTIPNYFEKLVELDDLVYETILATPNGQKYGLTIINDMTGINRKFIKALSPKNSSIIGKKLEIMPIQEDDKRAHIILQGFFVNIVLNFILPLVGNLKQMAIFHKEPKSRKLKEAIGEEFLPHEYGGPEQNIFDESSLYEFLINNYNYVQKSQQYFKIE